jgi:hypothetical protein
VLNITVAIAPIRLATGSRIKVTFLRLHDTAIALGQPLKARVAVALVETFLAQPIAVHAVDGTQEFDPEGFT